MKTTDTIVDIPQTRLLQHFIYWLTTVQNQTCTKKTCTGFVQNKYVKCEDIAN